MTASGLRDNRKHWVVKWANKSVMSTFRLLAVAIARLNLLEWASRNTIDSGGRSVGGIKNEASYINFEGLPPKDDNAGSLWIISI
jgi:hypothetical protein